MKILQAHKAGTPPYANHVIHLADRLNRLERWGRRLLGEQVMDGVSLFLRRGSCDAVVTADYRTALVYGMLNKLPGRRPVHVAKEFYFDERLLASRLRRGVYRWALNRLAGVVTNCSGERETYSRFLNLPVERFHFLPWPANLPPSAVDADDGYVFAAGRSFRDWGTLFAAARQVSAPFVVVAEREAVANLERPENVTLYCDVPREDYLRLLRQARVVAVPLRPTVRSIGQAVILEAMALGKPVVAVRAPGTVDYVSDGRTGLLCEPGQPDDLARQLRRLLEDDGLADRLGRAGLQAVEAVYNKARYSESMLALLQRLTGQEVRPSEVSVPVSRDPEESAARLLK